MNIKKILETEGFCYEWYIDEAKSIVRELEQGKKSYISEAYINEKITNVRKLFEQVRKISAKLIILTGKPK